MAEEPEAHHDHRTPLPDAQFSTLAMIGTGANPILFERVRYRPYGEAAHRFPGDFDDDAYCNSADQTLLTNALNAAIGQGAYDVAIDLNRDGVINSSDQTQFNWWSGRSPLAAGR